MTSVWFAHLYDFEILPSLNNVLTWINLMQDVLFVRCDLVVEPWNVESGSRNLLVHRLRYRSWPHVKRLEPRLLHILKSSLLLLSAYHDWVLFCSRLKIGLRRRYFFWLFGNILPRLLPFSCFFLSFFGEVRVLGFLLGIRCLLVVVEILCSFDGFLFLFSLHLLNVLVQFWNDVWSISMFDLCLCQWLVMLLLNLSNS